MVPSPLPLGIVYSTLNGACDVTAQVFDLQRACRHEDVDELRHAVSRWPTGMFVEPGRPHPQYLHPALETATLYGCEESVSYPFSLWPASLWPQQDSEIFPVDLAIGAESPSGFQAFLDFGWDINGPTYGGRLPPVLG
ncbi:MAG: hypothetical protein Q9159_003675 [Coniocarpon cinnabarinum]